MRGRPVPRPHYGLCHHPRARIPQASNRKKKPPMATTEPIIVQIRRLPHGQGLALPTRMTADAAGVDLPAAVADDVILAASQIRVIPCGFAMAVPAGFEAQIRPRSGL